MYTNNSQDMSSLNKYIGNNKLVLLICSPDLTASGSALKLAKRRFGMSLFLVISLSYWVTAFLKERLISLCLEHHKHVFTLDFLGLHMYSYLFLFLGCLAFTWANPVWLTVY